MRPSFTLSGRIVDILNRQVSPGTVEVTNGIITSIKSLSDESTDLPYILPGFIDSHVHIESSMLIPSEFARLAVVHGTVATVSDPHEIANVCGLEGVEFMIENGKTVPFKFNFGAPSCVPATGFETAGARLDTMAVKQLLSRPEIRYLSEMMNFPGVLFNDPQVMEKIRAAQDAGKPVDGHAPGLRGEDAKKYIAAGMSTDHECFTSAEALEKLQSGMKILVREGSAAKNFDALVQLLDDHSENMMFCSDDKHPDSLVSGHINELCARAVQKGIDPFKVLRAACLNPVTHYKLNVGLLMTGDPADFIVVADLVSFKVLQTYIDGELVAKDGLSLINRSVDSTAGRINNFNRKVMSVGDFSIPYNVDTHAKLSANIIEALDGQLITNAIRAELPVRDGYITADPNNDILKIVVVNRYSEAPVGCAFIKNFGLVRGALASSVAHDSHNIVAVGVSDEAIMTAVNLVIEQRGGISCVDDSAHMVIPLPVGGLMTDEDGYVVADAYTAIDRMAKSLGSTLLSPFMTLSFMALLVIPSLKLSDKGLFDGKAFKFI